MREQKFDPWVKFSCGSCTACCNQPWRTLIEVNKAHALDDHDFSAYPQLAGRKPYHQAADGRKDVYDLAKGEGNRCIYLDTDGLCIIHKEMGPEAKPHACLKFPYGGRATPVDDRVSANFGCPSVQASEGPPLTEQAREVVKVVSVSSKPADPESPIPLDSDTSLTQAQGDAFFDRAVAMFDEQSQTNLWARFADLLAMLVAIKDFKQSQSGDRNGADDGALVDALRSGQPLPNTPKVPEIRCYPTPTAAPAPVRLLFVGTLYPDTLPPDATTAKLGLLKRLTLIPKLISLPSFRGTYPSRLLGRNVCLGEVMRHDVEDELDPPATQLLCRYYRSRLWQRYLAGTKLSIVAGIHQHIHDLNAIMFFALAEAQRMQSPRLTEALVSKALNAVEFHLANQTRVYEQTLRGWFQSQLQNPALALQSLRLMALKQPKQAATSTAEAN